MIRARAQHPQAARLGRVGRGMCGGVCQGRAEDVRGKDSGYDPSQSGGEVRRSARN